MHAVLMLYSTLFIQAALDAEVASGSQQPSRGRSNAQKLFETVQQSVPDADR